MVRKISKIYFAIGVILLFLFSSISSTGYEANVDGISTGADYNTVDDVVDRPCSLLIDAAWPQQGYNSQHLGRSPYSTESNPGIEKWRFPVGDWCHGSPSIGSDGAIYFGSDNRYLYAVYPNGTLKWKFKAERGVGDFGSHSAIADDGTIYFGTCFGSYIQAVNPDGTEKWKYQVPEIDTSITIDDDGVIYYGHRGDGVDARYPNGTLKWRFSTGGCVMSTPAVDDNGIVYFGAHDYNIYAVYPNGTEKWRYHTGHWVHGSPTIAPDGTIYCGSDDKYVYAFYQNGTLKWKTKCASGMRCSPSLDKDGNLYFGVSDNRLYSLAPNGSIRWSFTIGNDGGVWGSTAAVSDDGTVYFGSHIDFGMLGGGEIIVLDLDGNLLWRKTLCDSVCRSSPVIGADGSVYICASNDLVGGGAPGYLHAFGSVENNGPPDTPIIDGPTEVQVGEDIKFRFKSDDDDLTPVRYFVDWDDGTTTTTHDFEPGIFAPVWHNWDEMETYTIKCKAIDTFGLESDWAYLKIKVPVNQQSSNSMFHRFLERFPNAFPILRNILGF
jgi:outer membrane protein assembly factor BamB